MTIPTIHRILTTTALCLAAVGLSSCRLALHTLPDYVGKQEFELYDADKPGYEVYSCEDVLYVKLPGYYVHPRVAVFESQDLKDGNWGNAFGYSPRPHIKESILYFPLTRELVSMWNARNDKKPLRFVRYQSGFLTEDQIKEKHGKLIAHGSIYGRLKTVICEAATRKNYAHYALRPIAIPLELVDTVSTIPLSAAAGATGIVVGVSVTIIGSVTQPHQQQTEPQPHQRQTVQPAEPENKTSEEE